MVQVRGGDECVVTQGRLPKEQSPMNIDSNADSEMAEDLGSGFHMWWGLEVIV